MQRPTTQYAKSGNLNIAYQVLGDGPRDLVYAPAFVSHVELLWDEPLAARFLERLATFSRVILFDKRGTGGSDPVPLDAPPTIEERIADNRAQTVADSVMYRQALATAAEGRGWSVRWYDRDRVFRDAASALGGEDVESFLQAMGRSIGPPWQARHKLAAAAALAIAASGDRDDHRPRRRTADR